jgi:Flp pilus assembly protein TadG
MFFNMKIKYSIKRKGQTLIETAIILFLLLLILLGITEFARAWFTKNSLKNAAREGARVAAITTPPSAIPNSFTCTDTTTCPNLGAPIQNAVCCQPGIPKPATSPTAYTQVTLQCSDSAGNPIGSCTSLTSGGGGEIEVSILYHNEDFFIVGDSPWPWSKSIDWTTAATMRYEG